VTPASDGGDDFILMTNGLAWSRDYGSPTYGGAHDGDVGPATTIWRVEGSKLVWDSMLTHGHWGLARSTGDFFYSSGDDVRVTDPGAWNLYIESGKHGTWPNILECNDHDAYECYPWDSYVRPLTVNIGEPPPGHEEQMPWGGEATINDLNDVQRCGPHDVLFEVFPNEAVWSDPAMRTDPDSMQKFCGGLSLDCDAAALPGTDASKNMASAANHRFGSSSVLVGTPVDPFQEITCGTP